VNVLIFYEKIAKQPYIKSIAKIYELKNNSSLIPTLSGATPLIGF